MTTARDRIAEYIDRGWSGRLIPLSKAVHDIAEETMRIAKELDRLTALHDGPSKPHDEAISIDRDTRPVCTGCGGAVSSAIVIPVTVDGGFGQIGPFCGTLCARIYSIGYTNASEDAERRAREE